MKPVSDEIGVKIGDHIRRQVKHQVSSPVDCQVEGIVRDPIYYCIDRRILDLRWTLFDGCK